MEQKLILFIYKSVIIYLYLKYYRMNIWKNNFDFQ